MSTIANEIANKFLERLSESEEVSEAQAQALRELMARGSKLKVPEIEAILNPVDVASL